MNKYKDRCKAERLARFHKKMKTNTCGKCETYQRDLMLALHHACFHPVTHDMAELKKLARSATAGSDCSHFKKVLTF